MNKQSFGLDIGVTTIKTVSLSRQGDLFFLNAVNMSPTPPKGMLSESPLDEEEMAQSIKKAVEDAKINIKYVNVALAENQVYTKVVEMPLLSDKELASAIYWEAEQYIPVPLSSITLVWNVLKKPEPGTGEKMHVLMVGAPSALINKYQKIITMAGLTINSIETEILSAIRALVSGNDFPSTLVVSVGSVSTSLAIIREGVMIFTYSIPTGGAAINRAIASDFGLTVKDAEEYKKVYGVSKEVLGGKIGQATKPILDLILTEIKKALAFYQDKYKDDKPIRQILLSGGTAKLPGIDTFFTNNANIETAIANPWKILTNRQVPKEIIDNAPDYTIAVGLAMRDYG